MTGSRGVGAALLALALLPGAASPAEAGRSITDRSLSWPDWPQWRRVLLLEDYNTRVVVFGTTLLGLAAGTVGSFTLLRKRALMGDALSHATLPGIAAAFIAATAAGIGDKSLPVLLLGAAASGLAGVAGILFIRNLTRLKEDTALGIVLSVFFGAGVALLGIVQQMRTGHAAGLEAFIYGKTASMIASDAYLIGGAALVCAVTCGILFKELKALCFDEGFARSRGLPVVLLDMVLMGLVVTVTIIGLQAVGLVLVIALLVTPAAAARFWTERLSGMVVIAALLGAASGMTGAAMSAILPRLPSGAMIVLVGTAFFLVSMGVGPARGVAVRIVRRIRLNSRIDRRHLLRGVFELLEARGVAPSGSEGSIGTVSPKELLRVRSWSPRRLRRLIRRAERAGLVRRADGGSLRLTEEGFHEAARLAREHRLWELYLITYADVAPGLVDRDADAIEHVLGPELVRELEDLIERNEASGVPLSPHPIRFGDRGAGWRRP